MAERTSIAHSQLSTSIEAKRIHKALSCNDSSMLIPCAYLLDLNIPKKPHLGRKEAILFILDPQFPVAILAKRKHSSSIWDLELSYILRWERIRMHSSLTLNNWEISGHE